MDKDESWGDERKYNAMMALLIGDAAGVFFETKEPSAIPDLSLVNLFDLPKEWIGGHDVSLGVFSDDGSTALVMLDSLTTQGRLDVEDFGRRMLRWLDENYLASGGRAFGAGGTTRAALDNLRRGVPAQSAGIRTEAAMDNNPLMRAFPLALLHNGSDEDLVHDTFVQCEVTHAHPRPRVVAAAYALWTRFTLETPTMNAFDNARAATAWLIDLFGRQQDRRRWVAPSVLFSEAVHLYRMLETERPTGAGHISQTFISAVWANRHDLFASVVTEAVQLGLDTDSTAAAAAGIAALRLGSASIPLHWRGKVAQHMPPEAIDVLDRLRAT